MIQRKQAAHLTHLVGHQGVELSEVCFEKHIRFLLRGILNYMGSIGFVEGCYTVITLGEVGGHSSDGKLGLGLSKPNLCIICLELWELDCDSVDIKGGSGRGFGFVGHLEDKVQVLVS